MFDEIYRLGMEAHSKKNNDKSERISALFADVFSLLSVLYPANTANQHGQYLTEIFEKLWELILDPIVKENFSGFEDEEIGEIKSQRQTLLTTIELSKHEIFK